MERIEIGIIGGSGFYNLAELTNRREIELTTPFGKPSDALLVGELGGKRVAFLARHNRKHHLLPTELNYRANIYAFKMLGAKYLISASAVGSMKEELKPTHFSFPDQFIDRTRHRVDTFFGDGIVAHVSLADPICPILQKALYDSAQKLGIPSHLGGTYLCMEGPQFSTRAESLLYRSWGVSVIGMTNLQEARLAREAELPYATIAMVTDYDCWHAEEEPVSVEMVVRILHQNAEAAAKTIVETIAGFDVDQPNPIHDALKFSILTQEAHVGEQRKRQLAAIVGKYFNL